MEKLNNNKYTKGNYTKTKNDRCWFIGDFLPKENAAKNKDIEIVYSELKKGFEEKAHYHQKKMEILLILSGEVIYTINGNEVRLKGGNYLYVAPNNEISGKCIKKCKLLAIHSPSIIKAKNPSDTIKN